MQLPDRSQGVRHTAWYDVAPRYHAILHIGCPCLSLQRLIGPQRRCDDSTRRGARLPARRYHSLTVDWSSLPSSLQPIAWTCGGHHAVELARDRPTGQQHNGGGGGAGAPAAAGPQEQAQQHEQQHQQQQAGSGPGSSHAAQRGGGGGDGPPGSLLMGVACADQRPHFGVQFHPESIATRYGNMLLANFVGLAAALKGTPYAINP